MNKTEFVRVVAEQAELSQKDSGAFRTTEINILGKTVGTGESV